MHPKILTKTDHSISIGVEQLEGGLVQGVGEAQEALERLELRIRDESILAGVDDGCQKPDRVGIVIFLVEQSQELDHKILSRHKLLAILLDRSVLGEDLLQLGLIGALQITAALQNRIDLINHVLEPSTVHLNSVKNKRITPH